MTNLISRPKSMTNQTTTTTRLAEYEVNHMQATNSHTSLHVLKFEAASAEEAEELARDWWSQDYPDTHDWIVEVQAICPAIERRRNQYIDVQGMLASILVLAFKIPLEIADFEWLTSQLDNFPNNRL